MPGIRERSAFLDFIGGAVAAFCESPLAFIPFGAMKLTPLVDAVRFGTPTCTRNNLGRDEAGKPFQPPELFQNGVAKIPHRATVHLPVITVGERGQKGRKP